MGLMMQGAIQRVRNVIAFYRESKSYHVDLWDGNKQPVYSAPLFPGQEIPFQDVYSDIAARYSSYEYGHILNLLALISFLLLPVHFVWVSLILVAWALHSFHRQSRVHLQYGLDKRLKAFDDFQKTFGSIRNSKIIWGILDTAIQRSGRKPLELIYRAPKKIKLDFAVPCLTAGGDYSIFFLPDVVLVESGKKIAPYLYSALKVDLETCTYREPLSESPSDAETLEREYEYMTVKGERDMRYKVNPAYLRNRYPDLCMRGTDVSLRIVASKRDSFDKINLAFLKDAKSLVESITVACQVVEVSSGIECQASHSASSDESPDNKTSENLKSAQREQQALPVPPAEIFMNPRVATAEPKELVTVATAEALEQRDREFKIPPPVVKPESTPVKQSIDDNRQKQLPSGRAQKLTISPTGTWILSNATVVIKGYSVKGGMFYVHSGSNAPHPSSVSYHLSVVSGGDYSQPIPGYWPSYLGLDEKRRGAYLSFLEKGRYVDSPVASIGYVFLYYYGLEYRLFKEILNDEAQSGERRLILDEIKRLLSIYGENNSFKSYASNLLEFFNVGDEDPISPDSWDAITACNLPVREGVIRQKFPSESMKRAIDYIANSGQTLSADFAYLWTNAINLNIQPEVKRNKAIFYKAFCYQFDELYPNGMALVTSTTHRRIDYRTAMMGLGIVSRDGGAVKNVYTAEQNIRGIREVVERVNNALEPFWRFKRRNPDASQFMNLIQIPASYWPEKAIKRALKISKATKLRLTSFGEFYESFDLDNATRPLQMKLFGRLSEIGVYAEPNVLAGAGTLKLEDNIVLYQSTPGVDAKEATEAYQVANIYAEIACAIAQADGAVDSNEIKHIHEAIGSWPDLVEHERLSLVAKVTLFLDRKVSFAKLKNKLQEIPIDYRQHIAERLVSVVSLNGHHKDELLLLDKVVSALGIESSLASLLAQSTTKVPPGKLQVPPSAKASVIEDNPLVKGTPSVALDFGRIKQLQAETAEITKVLNAVFNENAAPSEERGPVTKPESLDLVKFEKLPNLTAKQAIFLSALLMRDQWPRDELVEVAREIGLMLDGALDVINEACWEIFDDALLDGESFIDLNMDIANSILQSKNIVSPAAC